MSSLTKFRACLLICCLVFTNVCAQGQNPQRGVVGGLLRELLESELERRSRRDEPPRPPAKSAASAKSQQARGYFQSFSAESQQLARLLGQQARTTPGVRSHYDEVLKLRARADFLNQRYAQPQPDQVLIQDIRELDRDWRLASYHLNGLPSLSPQCRETAKRLDAINGRCCQLFNIGPQFNRREIVRLADSLAAELHHLQRDVEYELRSQPQARKISNQLRRIEARAKLLGDSATDGDSYEIVVGEFQRFHSEWGILSRQLSGFRDRHIDRTVEEIHEINRRLHEQLLLPLQLDRSHLTQLTNQLESRLDALTEMFTLAMLADLPDPAGLLNSTRTLSREIALLRESLARNAPEQALVSHWQVLNAGWREFERAAQPVWPGRGIGLRREISALLDAMRSDLGAQLAFDPRAVLQLAAELEGIVEQTQFHVQRWRSRPGARVSDGLVRSVNRFTRDCHALHEMCADRSERSQLARRCDELARGWADLRPQLMACKTVDRNAVRRNVDLATQRLVRLQLMLEQ